MNDFKKFSEAVHKLYSEMSKSELYVVDAGELFDKYLASFPPGTDPVFRVNTVHTCSCCKNFVRNIGNLVTIENGKVSTVWDVAGLPEPYQTVADSMAAYVGEMAIKSIFRTKETKFGNEFNYEILPDGGTTRWDHFHGSVARKHQSLEPATVKGQFETMAGVFRRGLQELTLDAMDIVIDLISDKAIYRGEEHLKAVKEFRVLKNAFSKLNSDRARELFVWENIHNPAVRFRNTVIGTLITDLSDGVDLEKAVKTFEAKVAPQNYKRPTALITKRMVTDAMKTLSDLGLESAIDRRFARISDVSVNDVLFVDNEVRGQMKGGLEDLLLDEVKEKPLKDGDAMDVTVDDFLAQIVPQASSIELALKNNHLSNFVSLTAPAHEDVPPLFKWGNSFGWSYDGEVTDSITEKVKAAGGRTDALLRFSLAWSNFDDLDLHASTPNGHIYYSNRRVGDGHLDVDMNAGSGKTREPVENIIFDRLRDGDYKIWVNQFSLRETKDVGFTLQVTYGQETKEYRYNRKVTGNIQCITFKVKSGRIEWMQANKQLKSEDTPVQKWGVSTGARVPVDSIMLSPNHWDGNSIGNKHWMFILKGCRNPEPTRGIYNEFLRPDLERHRKVFEVLGTKTKCQPSDDQLSGVGFSSTRNDSVVAVVKGSRISGAFNIKF